MLLSPYRFSSPYPAFLASIPSFSGEAKGSDNGVEQIGIDDINIRFDGDTVRRWADRLKNNPGDFFMIQGLDDVVKRLDDNHHTFHTDRIAQRTLPRLIKKLKKELGEGYKLVFYLYKNSGQKREKLYVSGNDEAADKSWRLGKKKVSQFTKSLDDVVAKKYPGLTRHIANSRKKNVDPTYIIGLVKADSTTSNTVNKTTLRKPEGIRATIVQFFHNLRKLIF